MPDYRQMTKDFEGFSPTEYMDSEGVPTIGYGFNRQTYPDLPDTMTREQADEFFNPIYAEARKRAMRYLGQGGEFEAQDPRRQAILTDMSYNMGNKLSGFEDMRAAILANQPQQVRNEMVDSKWYGQVGDRSKAHVSNW